MKVTPSPWTVLKSIGCRLGLWLLLVVVTLVLLWFFDFWVGVLWGDPPVWTALILVIFLLLGVGYFSELKDSVLRRKPTDDVIVNFAIVIWYSVFVAALLSVLLVRVGGAKYEFTGNFPDLPFIEYYLWVLVDMFPVLEAPSSLGWPSPMSPCNTVAGVPVVAYRLFLILGLLRYLRRWWGQMDETSAAK
jgi:hypothetical protein